MTCTRRNDQPEITIQSARLPNFDPPGLEVDDGKDADSDIESPFLISPIERDQTVKEVDRPLHPGEKYFLPSDKAELARLDLQHMVWTWALDGDLFKAPIKGPKHVLDVGTGTGIWAMDFAKAYPDAEILGTDLGKPTPQGVPPNCKFEERDFTDQWGYTNEFDLIHCRLLFSAKHDPLQLLQQAYDSLAPGGYLEYQDMYGFPMDVDGTLRGTDLEAFCLDGMIGLRRLGNTSLLSLPLYKQWMSEIGFEDVVEVHRALPINGWPKGAYKTVGRMMLKNIEAGLGGLYTRLFTNGLGWSPEKAADAVQKALDQMADTSIHAYFPIFAVYGRKPLSAT
ncbi:S-adenosyl-L-methionine-dependent methyltransferase [Hypoxylon cercidicola]|nr:S-adenosyl-L-methionine-dependent methyltransferase [Hypoxylon cercidicola]